MTRVLLRLSGEYYLYCCLYGLMSVVVTYYLDTVKPVLPIHSPSLTTVAQKSSCSPKSFDGYQSLNLTLNIQHLLLQVSNLTKLAVSSNSLINHIYIYTYKRELSEN